jgi:hypothetical protein
MIIAGHLLRRIVRISDADDAHNVAGGNDAIPRRLLLVVRQMAGTPIPEGGLQQMQRNQAWGQREARRTPGHHPIPDRETK